MTQLTCFKAYDIRGELGEELNEDIAYRIGRAYGEFLKPGKIVVGGDVRLTSESLKLALARGLMDAGTDVLDIGLSGTEEIYFATFHLGVDGGIEVTASHNPMNYNGMKLVRENAKPISGDTGLRDIQRLAEENQFPPVDPARRGTLRQISVLKEYVDHLMGYVDLANFTRPLKLVVNSGNGAAGHVIDEVEKRFAAAGAPVTFIKVHHQPDGHFPNGIPNPLLPECRQDTADAVRAHQADMGIAFDGDFDRCFLFDDEASFIEGYYIVGPAGGSVPAEAAGGENHSRPASDVEHGGHRDPQRRPAGDVEDGACVHQGADAPGRRHLRRGDECAPLLPRLRLLRQRDDPVAAGGGAAVPEEQFAEIAGGGPPGGVPGVGGDQPQAGECGGGDSAHPGAV